MKRVALFAALLAACVTTKTVDPARDPDPRAAVRRTMPAPRVIPPPVVHRALRMVTQLSDRDPLVAVRILFEAGSRDDPSGKEGLTSLTAALMSEATEQLSSSQLREALYPWAASAYVQVDKDVTAFVGHVHADHAKAFGAIFADLLLHPRFDPADFERLRAEAISEIEAGLRAGDDEALQRETLESLIYDAPTLLGSPAPTKDAARHPYRHTPTGTVAGLKAITLDDVKAQAQRAFNRDAAILGVAGGASQGFVDDLHAALDRLPQAQAARPPLPPPVEPTATSMWIVDKPSAGTAISVGYAFDLDRGDPDYAAMKVAESWFGEHRSAVGHLFNAMRERRGLNYGDYAYVEHFVQAGWTTDEALNIGRPQQYFSIWIRPVQHENRTFALRQTIWELRRFAQEGIPDDESFRRIQSFLDGSWQGKQQQAMRRLGYALDDAYYAAPLSRDEVRKKIATLTRAEVNAAIKRHLRGDRLWIAAVTQDGAAWKEALLRGDPAPMKYEGAVDDATKREDEEIAKVDLGLTPQTITVAAPDALFAR